ncbi:MAG: DUF2336 domain-containing protein [Alphaproteobacteria bacterium]|nr:MAG: DUF2336 domain-containing protein [Alphaproteobacteria bacterium]
MPSIMLTTQGYEARIADLFSGMSPNARLKTAQMVAEGFANHSMIEEDLELTRAILEHLVQDFETSVRRAISEAVRDCEFLPRDLALRLARDIDEVSLPLVEQSPLFTDEDLLEFLQSASDAKQTAIAGRHHTGRHVNRWIAENGCYPAVQVSLTNETALIGEEGYSKIIDRFGTVETIQKLMIRRNYLPNRVIGRLCDMVSDEYKKVLEEKARMSERTSPRMIVNAREKALCKSLNRRMTDHEQRKMCISLHRDGRLTATLMLRCLLTDNHSFFAAALGYRSGISKKRVISLTSGRGYLGLQRLYERAELSPYLYTAVRTTLEEMRRAAHYHPRADKDNFRQRMIDQIADDYGWEDGLSLEDLMEKLLPNRLY